MRVWIDMTASAHVLVFRPLVELLRARGDEVEITAREYAQTLQLLELHGMTATLIGHHGGRSRARQGARRWPSRLRALRRWARGRDFDLALAHGSHELTMTARAARHPERDDVRLRVGVAPAPARLPRRDAGRRARTRSRPSGSRATAPCRRSSLQYPGLKEEYYLADFEPDPSVLGELGDRPGARSLVVLRPPPDVSLYHRHSNPLFPLTLEHLGRARGRARDRPAADRGAARLRPRRSRCRR